MTAELGKEVILPGLVCVRGCGLSCEVYCMKSVFQKQTNSVAFSRQANYTDWGSAMLTIQHPSIHKN
jgi:hypothetical protein